MDKAGRPGATPERNSMYPWYVVSVLSLAYLVSFLDRVVISLLIVPIQADLQISDTEISLIVGLSFAIFYTLFGLPVGRLVDRCNRKWIIICGILMWSLATAACGLAKTFWHLLIARIFVAVGEATLSPSAYSMITDYFKASRLSLAMSIYNMGMFGGAGASLVMAGYVIALISGYPNLSLPFYGPVEPWQIVFISVGLPGVLIAILMLTVKEPRRRGLITVAKLTEEINPAPKKNVPIKETLAFMRLNFRTYGGLMGALSLSSLYGYALNAWAPTYFIRTHGWDGSSIGLIYGSVVLVSGLAGVALGGLYTDFWDRRGVVDAKIRTLVLGYIFMLAFSVVGPLAPNATLAIIFLGLANFGFSFPVGGGVAALQTITPNEMRGQVSAIYLFVLNVIGLGLGPTSVALITDHVFGDQMALKYSLVITASVALPIAIGLLVLTCKHYIHSLNRSKEWVWD